MEETSSDKQSGVTKEALIALVEGATDVLSKDVERYWDLNIKEPNDIFWRRGLVRAVFAYVEGLTSTLRVKALLTHASLQMKLAKGPFKPSDGTKSFSGVLSDLYRHLRKAEQGANFSHAELLLLLERSYRLDDKGHVKWTKAKTPTANNLQFAFRMYAKAAQVDYALPRGESGWQDFKTAIKIRDRLTHPKKSHDLDVSEDETQIVLKAYSWLFQCQGDFLRRVKEKVESEEKAASSESLPQLPS